MRCSGTTVTLPRLGTIRTHESTEALARKIVEGKARILSATVSRSAQRWFVSFTVEVDPNLPDRHPRPGTAVGVDVGLKALVTAVDHRGQVIPVPGPRPLRSALRRLRRASRAHSRKQKGSANRQKSARRLARIHARIANCRGTPRSQLRGDPRRLARSLAEDCRSRCPSTASPSPSWCRSTSPVLPSSVSIPSQYLLHAADTGGSHSSQSGACNARSRARIAQRAGLAVATHRPVLRRSGNRQSLERHAHRLAHRSARQEPTRLLPLR
jgi:hypothetical protein